MTIGNTNSQPVLHEVFGVNATNTPGVYMLDVELTDMAGERYRCQYVSDPADEFGLAPAIRQWLIDNEGNYSVGPYIPPTPEELRASMQDLTARQFRLGLQNAGLTPAQVTATIDALPAGIDKETAKVEWEYATTFHRMHPLIATVGAALGLNDDQIDAMWRSAQNL